MKSKTIFVNQEVMKKLTCPMDFDKFPFDVQKCNFSMFDALNYADTLVFVDETKYIYDISENSKYYVKVEGLNYTTTWKGHSMIGFDLILTRKTHIYLASIYLPSAMFVVMSWLRYGIFLSKQELKIQNDISLIETQPSFNYLNFNIIYCWNINEN